MATEYGDICDECDKPATQRIEDSLFCETHYQIAIGELEAKEDSELHGD